MARELALMVRFGLTPMQAITAATRNSAENLDLLHRVGTVATGKSADLILVDGDPLSDISVMSSVLLVVKEGTVYRDETAGLGHTDSPA